MNAQTKIAASTTAAPAAKKTVKTSSAKAAEQKMREDFESPANAIKVTDLKNMKDKLAVHALIGEPSEAIKKIEQLYDNIIEQFIKTDAHLHANEARLSWETVHEEKAARELERRAQLEKSTASANTKTNWVMAGAAMIAVGAVAVRCYIHGADAVGSEILKGAKDGAHVGAAIGTIGGTFAGALLGAEKGEDKGVGGLAISITMHAFSGALIGGAVGGVFGGVVGGSVAGVVGMDSSDMANSMANLDDNSVGM